MSLGRIAVSAEGRTGSLLSNLPAIVRSRVSVTPSDPRPVQPAFSHHDYTAVLPADLSLSHLVAAGCHLGHDHRLCNKHFLPFVYGRRHNLHIIDLAQTLPLLRRALKFLHHVTARGGVVLFYSRRPDLHVLSKSLAKETKMFYVNHWRPGTLTNMPEVLTLRQELPYIQPDVLVTFDSANCGTAIREATKMNVATVGVVDSDTDPRTVTYPIPANDDTFKSLGLMANLMKSSVLSADRRQTSPTRQTNLFASRRRW